MEEPREQRTLGRTGNGIDGISHFLKFPSETKSATPYQSLVRPCGVGGGGNRDPSENFGAEAPGGSDDGDDDTEDDEDDDRRKGRNDKTPADKGRRDERPAENEATEEPNRFSRILSAAMAETSKRPAEPPNIFTNAGHEDIRFWITRCQDYFHQNKFQWREEGDRI